MTGARDGHRRPTSRTLRERWLRAIESVAIQRYSVSGDGLVIQRDGLTRATHAAALWARRHLTLWIVLGTAVNAAMVILVSVLITLPGQSGATISALILVLLLLLALSVALPVIGHVVEQREGAAATQRLHEDRIDRLLAVGSARRLPRLSELANDVLGATPTRYTMAGNAPYVSRPGPDAEIRRILTAPGPPYPFVIVWGDTKSGKSRTLAEALRAGFVHGSHDPAVVLPRDGAALAELSRIGIAIPDDGVPAIALLDDLDPADLEALTPDVLYQVTSWAVIAATMTARRRSDVLKTGSEVGATARMALEYKSHQYELSSEPPTGVVRAEAERLYPGEHFDGSIAETLVGARELIARYKASHDESPAACAVMRAAIDCRRAGLSRPVGERELRSLFPSYLQAVRIDLAPTDELFNSGIEWATIPIASQVALLRRANPGHEPRIWTVFDHVVSADDGDDQQPRPIPPGTWTVLIDILNAEDVFGVGFAAYTYNEIQSAIAAFRKASTSSEQDQAQVAAISAGILLDDQGDTDGAAAAYQQVIDSGHPDHAPAALVNLGVLRARQGDTAGARSAYQRAIESGHRDQSSMAEVNLGLLLSDQGDTMGAKAAFQRAIESGHPDNAPAAAVNLGNLLAAQGDVTGARAAYQVAIDFGHPDHAVAAQVVLGTLLAQQDDIDGARAAFQRAIDSGHPEYAAMAELNLGVVLARQGDRDGARAAYQHILDSGDPHHVPSAEFNLGNLLFEEGDTVGARAAYQRAIDSGDPDNAPLAAVNLGNLLRRQGDPDGARTAYRRAIESDNPQQAAMAAVGLGNLLAQQGDDADARAAYELAINYDQADSAPAAATNLAVLLLRQGDVVGARAALTQAVNSGHPEFAPEAQRLLDSLS